MFTKRKWNRGNFWKLRGEEAQIFCYFRGSRYSCFFFQFCRVDPRVDTSWQQLKSAVKVCYVRFLLKPYPLVLTCSFCFLAKVKILRLSVCMSKVSTEISEENNLSCRKCLNSVSFIFARSLNYVRPMATWAVRSTTHAYTKLKFPRA